MGSLICIFGPNTLGSAALYPQSAGPAPAPPAGLLTHKAAHGLQQPSSPGAVRGQGRARAGRRRRAPWRTLPRARRRGRTPPARARTAPRSAWPPPPGSAGRAGAPRPVTLMILCDVTLMIWCNTATQYYVTAKQVAQALLALSIMMWCNVIMLLQSRSRRRSSPCYSEYSTRSLCYCTAPRRAGYLRVKQRPAAGRVSARR